MWGGNFKNILKFVSNYKLVDRLVGIEQITIAGVGNDLTATLTVKLPLGPSTLSVSPEDSLTLTEEEKRTLQAIIDSSLFSASPAKNPLGPVDPFK